VRRQVVEFLRIREMLLVVHLSGVKEMVFFGHDRISGRLLLRVWYASVRNRMPRYP